MYIHENYQDYTQKCGKYFNQYIRFDTKDKMNTLFVMMYFIEEYLRKNPTKNTRLKHRVKKIKNLYFDYINNNGPYVTWIINDSNVRTGIQMIEFCMNEIEKYPKLKHKRKIENRCWEIRCASLYWKNGFKCQGA